MRVDGYSGLQGTGPLDPKKEGPNGPVPTQRVSETALSAVESGSEGDSGDHVDTIEISAKARELLAGGGVSNTSEAPAVRPEAVERARQILQSGTYNNAGAIERTAGKIASLFSSEG